MHRSPMPPRLTLTELVRSVSHEGSHERLRCFWQKLQSAGASSNSSVRVGVVGGSVSAGRSTGIAHDQSGLFHRMIQRWLQLLFPNTTITHFNAAMPAVPPHYLEHCLELHVPHDADLIFVEAAANLCGKDFCADGLASVERIVRRLLDYPRRPALVFVHTFSFQRANRSLAWPHHDKNRLRTDSSPWLIHSDLQFEFHRSAWSGPANEDLLDTLAKYYSLPSVSIRDVIFHAMKTNSSFHGYRLTDLYYDRLHPSASGHAILAQALKFVMMRAKRLQDELSRMSSQMETATDTAANACMEIRLQPLPTPMHNGLQQPRMECHDAESIMKQGLVESENCHGWVYTVERSKWTGVPKPGWIASTAGARCIFAYALPSPSSVLAANGANKVGVAFLRSYLHMGRISLECTYQCSCPRTTIDGWWNLSFSPIEVVYIPVTVGLDTTSADLGLVHSSRTPRRCGLQMTILNDTSSGGHKFKVAGMFINRLNETDFVGRYIISQAMALKGHNAIEDSLEKRRRAIKAKMLSRRRKKANQKKKGSTSL